MLLLMGIDVKLSSTSFRAMRIRALPTSSDGRHRAEWKCSPDSKAGRRRSRKIRGQEDEEERRETRMKNRGQKFKNVSAKEAYEVEAAYLTRGCVPVELRHSVLRVPSIKDDSL